MNQPTRFQLQSVLYEQSPVTAYRGIDPLTGLPVLIYHFPARPTVAAGTLESENIPGILEATFRQGQGQVVTAYSKGYRPLKAGAVVEVERVLLEAARGLRDAAGAGVVHGDIRPERLLHANGHILIEGFGVPWTAKSPTFAPPETGDEPDYAGDIYALGRTIQQLFMGKLSDKLEQLLESCLTFSPKQRPSAEAFFQQLRQLAAPERLEKTANDAGGEAAYGQREVLPRNFFNLSLETSGTPSPVPPQPETAPAAPEINVFDSLELNFDPDTAVVTSQPLTTASGNPVPDLAPPPPLFKQAKEPTVKAKPAHHQDEAEPIAISTDPGREHKAKPVGVRAPLPVDNGKNSVKRTVIKDLPPGGTYRTGLVEEKASSAIYTPPKAAAEKKPASRAGWGLRLLLVIIIAGFLAYLAFWRQGLNNVATPQGGQAVAFIVDVQVEPDNLPPVTLLVVKSPPGSELPPGTILGNAPRKIVLDRQGNWELQGRFQDRLSETVELEIPRDRNVIITIPAALPK